MGRPETSEQKGLIPRSLEQIFQASQALQLQGWKYKMQVNYLEFLVLIYLHFLLNFLTISHEQVGFNVGNIQRDNP